MRIAIALGSIALALALAACTQTGGPQVAGGADCAALFRHYDIWEQRVRRPDYRTIPPGLTGRSTSCARTAASP